MKATRMMAQVFLAAAIFLQSPGSQAADDAAIVAAQKLFRQYVDLEHAFDPAQAELYASSATIKNTRIYPEGNTKTISYSGEDFKKLLRAAAPVAKIRNDTNSYSQVTFSHEGAGVKIKCMRLSQLKQYSSPLEILVAPADGSWKIVEETSQSRP